MITYGLHLVELARPLPADDTVLLAELEAFMTPPPSPPTARTAC